MVTLDGRFDGLVRDRQDAGPTNAPDPWELHEKPVSGTREAKCVHVPASREGVLENPLPLVGKGRVG